ncbi:uncharacterized protein LOC111788696 [Cucurbita pepo subsp. pepo]|uniref:uncharacterized protein LOC111788696 n=1 Tax=Cucurbita pepo subsp. pepo TaxID=3664 RepID=UPI000C9D9C47|nr:uncharacterized protein LOC111788696 [Cucurbita pepo subsp. pepo]
MGGLLHQPCSVALCKGFHEELEDDWGKGGEYHHYNLASSTSSFEDSSNSSDDACSSTSNSSSPSNGALEDFTELFAQLPIKRGLSMFYEGKSQSFTSLSSVRSIEDLPKKRSPYSSRLSGCKSYAGGLDTHKCAAYTLPKAPSFKKASSSSSSSSKKISVSCPGYERQ